MATRQGSRGALDRSDRLRDAMLEVAGVALIGTALFVLVSLVSYHPGDPSIFSNARGAAENACGRVGAFLADLILQAFGLSAFILPVALGIAGATVRRMDGWRTITIRLCASVVAAVALTVLLTVQWKYWSYRGGLILTGGAFGAWLADALLLQLNQTGATIASLGFFLAAFALATPYAVLRFIAGQGVAGVAHLLRWARESLARKVPPVWAWFKAWVVSRAREIKVGEALKRVWVGATRGMRKNPADKTDAEKEDAEQPAVMAPPPAATPEFRPSLELTDPVAPVETEAPVEEAEDDPKRPADPHQKIPMILPPSLQAKEAAAPQKPPKQLRFAMAKRGQWRLPTLEFLNKPPKIESALDRDKLIKNSQILVQKFADFDIQGEITYVHPGPVITLYEFKPGPGVKISRIAALADDLSMALSAQNVRIIAPMPGKPVVGIEIPSDVREKVFLRELLQHSDFMAPRHQIPVAMGKDIGGLPHVADLGEMPHLLCAGQTGSGKSVFMNSLICSLLYRFTPDELRMILVDPKVIELAPYHDIPHLLLPVVNDGKHASLALKWAVKEMERRYRVLAALGARNLAGFNQKVEELGPEALMDLLTDASNERDGGLGLEESGWAECFEKDEEGSPRVGKLPYIVVIIDELADLMAIAKKDVEHSIQRIAAKARAAGIHLVIATQRPSIDVVTGVIKANLPSRVSFKLAQYVDSKTILDRSGAERLLGQGDMLYIPPKLSQLVRLHGAYVDESEIVKITSYLKSQGKPVYRQEILRDEEEEDADLDAEGGSGESDPLYDEAVDIAKRQRQISTSSLQRHFRIGYNRAARLVDELEKQGVVGPADGARPREVLLNP